MPSLGFLLLLDFVSEWPLHQAWRHTGEFWIQVGATLAHHPVVLLVCAAVPAIERGFAYLHPGVLDRGRMALLEALVTLWRILLVAVAVWAASSGLLWQQIRRQASPMAAWQIALSQVGFQFAHHLRMVLWELLFLVLAVLVIYLLVIWCVQALGRSVPWMREPRHRAATLSIVRNLVFVPVLVIYLVEMARPTLQ